jgi:putative ABC transport system ATP-binding protein
MLCPTKNPVLTASTLEKTYASGARTVTVLRDVNLHIEAGDFVAILGPSGSGKTTLLGLLAGLDTPSRGCVTVNGTELSPLSEDERARFRRATIGFVFQSFQLMPSLTAHENVQVPLQLRGQRNVAQRAARLLERVGLSHRLHHYPAQLSGGEQQRVALARAFVNDPQILFADEPTGNLDGITGKTIIQLMEELNRERGTTLVVVTHDPLLASRAHYPILLHNGAIVANGVKP